MIKGLLISLLLIQIPYTMYAYDFGQRGQVYPIIETNFLDVIYNKLNKYKEEGRLDELNKEFTERVKKSIYRPKSSNIGQAVANRTFYFDPTLELEKDIKNENGNIIAKAGTKVNPLNMVRLSKKLLFINGDIQKEVEYARTMLRSEASTKVILVGGSVYETNRILGVQVYFDQEQRLINRFGLKFTPSVVQQEDKYLKINEVAL